AYLSRTGARAWGDLASAPLSRSPLPPPRPPIEPRVKIGVQPMRLMRQDRTKRTIIGRKSPVSAIHVVAVCDYCGDRSVGVFGNACLNFSGVKPTRNNPTIAECATASSEFVIDESQH